MQTFLNSTVRIGNTPIQAPLQPGGQPGDWSAPTTASISSPFGAAVPGKPKGVAQSISVVATPRTAGGVPVVAVITAVTAKDFTFRIRNADPDQMAESVSLDWLAVLGVPDSNPTAAQQMDARLSVLQPKRFDGYKNSRTWPRIWFSRPMNPTKAGAPPILLCTQTGLNCSPDSTLATVGTAGDLEGSDQLRADNIIDGVNDFGFSLRAVDVDSVGGPAGFSAAAFVANGDPDPQQGGPSITHLWFDHGSEKNVDTYFKDAVFPGTPYPVAPGGQNGDWRTVDVYFDRPFLTPPLVFATGRGRTPLVCVVRKVTTHGFTLSARNTDTVDGHALFHWVAIGSAAGPA